MFGSLYQPSLAMTFQDYTDYKLTGTMNINIHIDMNININFNINIDSE